MEGLDTLDLSDLEDEVEVEDEVSQIASTGPILERLEEALRKHRATETSDVDAIYFDHLDDFAKAIAKVQYPGSLTLDEPAKIALAQTLKQEEDRLINRVVGRLVELRDQIIRDINTDTGLPEIQQRYEEEVKGSYRDRKLELSEEAEEQLAVLNKDYDANFDVWWEDVQADPKAYYDRIHLEQHEQAKADITRQSKEKLERYVRELSDTFAQSVLEVVRVKYPTDHDAILRNLNNFVEDSNQRLEMKLENEKTQMSMREIRQVLEKLSTRPMYEPPLRYEQRSFHESTPQTKPVEVDAPVEEAPSVEVPESILEDEPRRFFGRKAKKVKEEKVPEPVDLAEEEAEDFVHEEEPPAFNTDPTGERYEDLDIDALLSSVDVIDDQLFDDVDFDAPMEEDDVSIALDDILGDDLDGFLDDESNVDDFLDSELKDNFPSIGNSDDLEDITMGESEADDFLNQLLGEAGEDGW